MECIYVRKTPALKGSIKVQGGKNAVLPILAASILTNEKVKIYNCPDIADVNHTIELLMMLGCKVEINDGCIEIDPSGVEDTRVSEVYTDKTRSSIIFLGAMLGRLKKTVITKPGGCKIGARPIDIHINALRKLNITIFEKYDDIIAFSEDIKGATIELPMPSVGATENIILAAATASGVTIINNAAMEPEIVELADFINAMGGRITGAGTGTIVIEGVLELKGTQYVVEGDRIVASTYIAAVAAVGGKVELKGIKEEKISSVISTFSSMGCKIKCKNDCICIKRNPKKRLKPIGVIETMPFPGVPTDVQPLLVAVLAYSAGVSRVHENLFENRFLYTDELNKMGADINIRRNDTALIYGREKLCGTKVKAMDLRGGAALVVAALGAEGDTIIENHEYIKRGYEDIVRDLRILGADIREEKIIEQKEKNT